MHVKLPSEGYRAIGGYSSHSIAVSRYTAPLSAGVSRCIPIPMQERPCRTSLTSLSLCRGESSLQKRIALHGGVAATLTPIALHCATKPKTGPGTVASLWKLYYNAECPFPRGSARTENPRTARTNRSICKVQPNQIEPGPLPLSAAANNHFF